MNRKSTVACLFAMCVVLCAPMAYAQEKVTPNQVYQVTEDILYQLNRMHEANFTKPDLEGLRLKIRTRLSRHVIFQALNVRSKIQVLQRVNGIEISKLSAPPVRNMTSADTLNVANEILADLIKFDKAYGLSPFKPQAPLVEGKNPTDVYVNLLKAEEMIVQLGIPQTVTNDVYTTVLSISKDLEHIRIAVGKNDIIEMPSSSFSKKMKDVYNLSFYALRGLQSLAKRADYAIPQGVIVPKRLSKNIQPRDIQQVLLYCLAELSAMKVKVEAPDKMYFPPAASGQNPSTVFDQIGFLSRQIRSLKL